MSNKQVRDSNLKMKRRQQKQNSSDIGFVDDPTRTKQPRLADEVETFVYSANQTQQEQEQEQGKLNVSSTLVSLEEIVQCQQACANFVEEIEKRIHSISSALKTIREDQNMLASNLDNRLLQDLEMKHNEVGQAILETINSLENIKHSTILQSPLLCRIAKAEETLQLLHAQMSLYISELRFIKSGSAFPPIIATLHITSQTFPTVITKSKNCDQADLTLTFLTAASQSFVPDFNKLKVLSLTDQKLTKSTQSFAEIHKIRSSGESAIVTLKMSGGTRKLPITVKFTLDITFERNHIVLESQISKPFIIITNECQYEESEGILIKLITFGQTGEEVDAIPWPAYANVLQNEFVLTTRQNLQFPERALSLHELNYMHTAFFDGNTLVTPKMSDHFWDWFGKLLQKVRYQRNIYPMWKDGFIMGIVSRGDINALLEHTGVGSFVVRFSEHNPGLFAVAYKTLGADIASSVRHYLIKAEEFGTKKTLPDLLRKYSEFSTIIKVVFNSDGTTSCSSLSKDEALSSFYSKVELVSNIHDYDASVKSTPHFPQTFGSDSSSSPFSGLGTFSFGATPQRRNSQSHSQVTMSPMSISTTNSTNSTGSTAKTVISSDKFANELTKLQLQFQKPVQPTQSFQNQNSQHFTFASPQPAFSQPQPIQPNQPILFQFKQEQGINVVEPQQHEQLNMFESPGLFENGLYPNDQNIPFDSPDINMALDSSAELFF